MSQQRNYDGTGAIESQNTIWVSINGKDGKITRTFPGAKDAMPEVLKGRDAFWKEPEVAGASGSWKLRLNGFAGYLDRFEVRTRPASGEIEEHIVYTLKLSAKDELTGEIATFGIDFRADNGGFTINVVNALLAAIQNPEWDGFVLLRTYIKNDYANLFISTNSRDSKEMAKGLIPWDETNKCPLGSPKAVPVMAADGSQLVLKGKPVWDTTARTAWWMDKARTIETYVNGSAPDRPAAAKTAPPPPSAPAQPEQDFSKRLFDGAVSNIQKSGDMAVAKKCLGPLRERGYTELQIATFFLHLGEALNVKFTSTGDVAPDIVPNDDLPF